MHCLHTSVLLRRHYEHADIDMFVDHFWVIGMSKKFWIIFKKFEMHNQIQLQVGNVTMTERRNPTIVLTMKKPFESLSENNYVQMIIQMDHLPLFGICNDI